LLSIPAILGALVLQTKDLVKGGTGETSESISAAAIIAGTLTSAVVGFFAVKWMLKIIREKSLYGFAIYTGILGILVLIDQFITKIIF
jgi:undecaprenyl-diphosphatase